VLFHAVLCHAVCSMGFSQWGANATKSACTHKSTKMALTQLNKSLADDLAEAGMAYIGVHNLSPGALSAPTASKEQVNLAALGGGGVCEGVKMFSLRCMIACFITSLLYCRSHAPCCRHGFDGSAATRCPTSC
jgi:hypothetical protein